MSEIDASKPSAFDIVSAGATTDGRLLTFMMEVAGQAGSVKPIAIGQLAGAKVESYVWPTSLDPAVVGFDPGSGILSLAITAHPDFDDTPLYDEDQDGDPANDGAEWHSHWVVLVEDAACGAGLKVRDVSPGVDLLPATAPYLPIALDSPGMSPLLDGSSARITVPVSDTENVAFDAVTAELQINEQAGPVAVRHRGTRHRLRRPVAARPRHRHRRKVSRTAQDRRPRVRKRVSGGTSLRQTNSAAVSNWATVSSWAAGAMPRRPRQ